MLKNLVHSNSRPLSSKPEWLKLLQQQDKDNPGKIDSPVAANATADLVTPATQSNKNIQWLYQQCQQAKVNMMTDVCRWNIFGGSPSSLQN
jgi:hypothetical protein